MGWSETVVAATGIVVSGIAGPWVGARILQNKEDRRFAREEGVARRDDLRSILDEASALLARGPRMVRLQLSSGRSAESRTEAQDQAVQVHAMRQRLLLRLAPDDPVADAYERARDALVAHAGAPEDHGLLEEFDRARDSFMDHCRHKLEEPITETLPKGAR